MIVPDAGLVVARFVPGADATLALRVHARDTNWAVPPNWRIPFRDRVAGEVRAGRLAVEEALTLEKETAEALRQWEVAPGGPGVLALAAATGCPAALCEFAWLAQTLAVVLVTSEPALLESFPDDARSPEAFLARPPAGR